MSAQKVKAVDPDEESGLDVDRVHDEPEFEFEVLDDTPEEDRGRPRRAPGEEPDIPDDDELEEYRGRAQDRIKKLRYEYHEERRAKEEARRVEEEAIRFAQQVAEENQKLRRVLQEGEKSLSESSRSGAEAKLAAAKSAYAKAYDEGDADAIAEAQLQMVQAASELDRWKSYKPQYQEAEPQQQQPPRQYPKPLPRDDRAVEWNKNNPWFGSDDEMTGYAMGLHTRLVKSGVHPQSDDYYRQIDTSMRRMFPDKFGEKTQEARQSRQPGTVVAPVTRDAKKPRKIQLTASQMRLINRLKITPEQYAKEYMKEAAKHD